VTETTPESIGDRDIFTTPQIREWKEHPFHDLACLPTKRTAFTYFGATGVLTYDHHWRVLHDLIWHHV
jgi:hypothetical protein